MTEYDQIAIDNYDQGVLDGMRTCQQEHEAELTRLREIVEKLPVTADDVPVVPHVDHVYFINRHTGNVNKLFVVYGGSSGFGVYSKAAGGFALRWYGMDECYSTREAAALSQKPSVPLAHRPNAEEGVTNSP